MIDKASSGPIKTKWGLAFRDYDDCLRYIRESNSLKVPEGGVVLPLAYTVSERPSYSIVPSNVIWQDPAHAETAARLRKNEEDNRRRNLYFPHVLRDARRIGEYHPGLSQRPRMHGPARRLAGAPRGRSARTSTMRRRWSAYSTPRSASARVLPRCH